MDWIHEAEGNSSSNNKSSNKQSLDESAIKNEISTQSKESNDTPGDPTNPSTDKEPVQVFVWSQEVGNNKDVGHTAIRIGDKVYGYYPTGSSAHGFGIADLLLSKGDMRVMTIEQFNTAYKGEEVTYFQLSTTPQEAKNLESTLSNYVSDPSHYSLLGKTCPSVAINAMISSGIAIRGPSLDPYTGHNLPSGTCVSPNELKGYLNSPINKDLINRSVRFVVGCKLPQSSAIEIRVNKKNAC